MAQYALKQFLKSAGYYLINIESMLKKKYVGQVGEKYTFLIKTMMFKNVIQ